MSKPNFFDRKMQALNDEIQAYQKELLESGKFVTLLEVYQMWEEKYNYRNKLAVNQ